MLWPWAVDLSTCFWQERRPGLLETLGWAAKGLSRDPRSAIPHLGPQEATRPLHVPTSRLGATCGPRSVPTSELPFLGLSCVPEPGEVCRPLMIASGGCTIANPAPARTYGLRVKDGPAPQVQWMGVWQEVGRVPPEDVPPWHPTGQDPGPCGRACPSVLPDSYRIR